MCDDKGVFKELDILTRKQVNSLPVKSATCCVVTYDNKFLVTAEYVSRYYPTTDEDKKKGKLTKWSIQSKKQLHTWQSRVGENLDS